MHLQTTAGSCLSNLSFHMRGGGVSAPSLFHWVFQLISSTVLNLELLSKFLTEEHENQTFSVMVQHASLHQPLQKDFRLDYGANKMFLTPIVISVSVAIALLLIVVVILIGGIQKRKKKGAVLDITVQPQSAKVGANILIPCTFRVDTPPINPDYLAICWYFQGKEILRYNKVVRTSHPRASLNASVTTDGIASLLISNIKIPDSGTYKCSVVYTPEEQEKEVMVNVYATPTIIITNNIVKKNKESFLISTIINFYPIDIDIKWLRDKEVLESAIHDTPQRNSDGTYSVKSSVTITPTEEHENQTFSVMVQHASLHQPLQKDFRLDYGANKMFLTPIVISVSVAIALLLIVVVILIGGIQKRKKKGVYCVLPTCTAKANPPLEGQDSLLDEENPEIKKQYTKERERSVGLAARQLSNDDSVRSAARELSSEKSVKPKSREPSSEKSVIPESREPSNEKSDRSATIDSSTEKSFKPKSREQSNEKIVLPESREPSSEKSDRSATREPSSEKSVGSAAREPSSEKSVKPEARETSSEKSVKPKSREPSNEKSELSATKRTI
ncbi:tyrosine-protein phosphatase non-receptor type substrate 1-like [Bombina bombina]|uniref:tyrosine-protein phosphatase non-receptor type substrate 1-like n=1 Tax=Bombina bombina TaxID=8345 RepID=UPI00235B2FC3|nr:tyrosine-protein phosphatase non-receptor type substrate 1-like [Bombina bombina]